METIDTSTKLRRLDDFLAFKGIDTDNLSEFERALLEYHFEFEMDVRIEISQLKKELYELKYK